MNAAQFEYPPALTGEPGDQCLDALQFLATGDDPLRRWRVVHDDHRSDVSDRVDSHDARASDLFERDIANSAEQISAAVLNMADTIERHDACVRFLHDIVDVNQCGQQPPQPGTDVGFVR